MSGQNREAGRGAIAVDPLLVIGLDAHMTSPHPNAEENNYVWLASIIQIIMYSLYLSACPAGATLIISYKQTPQPNSLADLTALVVSPKVVDLFL